MNKSIIEAAVITAIRVTSRTLDKVDLKEFKPKTPEDREMQRSHIFSAMAKSIKGRM
jgi:hypothetical protein